MAYTEGFENIKYNIAACLISGYLRLCGVLTKYKIEGLDGTIGKSAETPVIFAFWHNRQGFLLYPYRTHKKMCVLVSLSKDGEYIARALPKFNMVASRGSTTRGGASAYRGLIAKAKLGYSLALTPDGPRGPVYQASQGVLALARKTGFPIIPVGVYATSKFSVNSWDKFQVILPFGKCSIVLGKPLKVNREDNLKELSKELTLRIQDATSQAAKLCGVK